jgi:hypothetical protein
MNTFWESLKKSIQEGVHSVSEKTDELTKIGRLKIEIIAVKRDIEKSFMELGGRVYESLKSETKISLTRNTEIQNLAKKISGFEEKLEQLETEIRQIQELRTKKADPGAASDK